MATVIINFLKKFPQSTSRCKWNFVAKELKLTFLLFTALVHPENQLNTFLAYSGVDAWRVIEVQPSQPNGEHRPLVQRQN